MTLICKGSRVRVKGDGKALVRLPGYMLHDPDGRSWPKNSLLVGPFDREGREAGASYKGAAKAYLGRGHRAHMGGVDLPPKSLANWQTVRASVERIDYVRPGTKAPGGYHHDLNKPRGFWRVLHWMKGKGSAVLRKCGRFYRIDFPRGMMSDDRGISWP